VNGIGQQAKAYLSPLPTTRSCTKVMKNYTTAYLKNEEKKGKENHIHTHTNIYTHEHTYYIYEYTYTHVHIEFVI
jgi:hypothetical protein